MKFATFEHIRLWRHYSLAATLLIGLVLSAWFLKYNFENVGEQEVRVNNRLSTINNLGTILVLAADAETSVRGYLLTGKDTFLDPYKRASQEVWTILSEIEEQLAQNTIFIGSHKELADLEEAITEHLENLGNLIDRYEKRSNDEYKQISRITRGKTTMDRIRGIVAMMNASQTVMLSQRSESVRQSKESFMFFLTLSTSIIGLAIIFAFVQMARVDRKNEIESIEKSNEAKKKEFMADIAKMLSGNQSANEAGRRVLESLSKNLNIMAGRLFLMDKGSLKSFSDFGITERTDSDFDRHIRKNELGLVKSAFDRAELWEVENIPENYWSISSSLGEAKPSNLYFLPVCFQEEPIGIIELGSFEKLDNISTNLLKSITEVMGVGLNSSLFRQHLQELLEKTQQQSEELQAQQEELRTNNEELEQQARALEIHQESLNIKNRELEISKNKLEHNAKELKDSNSYKSDFLAKMSHELRTPLNGLLILSTLLAENKEQNMTSRQIDFANSINSAGNDLLMLINDILDLSKIEARKLSIHPESFSLKSLFESKKRNFEHQAKAKNIKFIADLPEELENFRIITDRQRLDQILRNFLSNAIKFTESGSVILNVEADKNSEYVTFNVIDTGIGIPKNKLQKVFQAFEQADSSTNRKYGGTGLGLTISSELALLLGAKIKVESIEGEGSKFSLHIPTQYMEIEENTQSYQINENQIKFNLKTGPEIDSSYNELRDFNLDDVQKNKISSEINKLDPSKKTILIVEDDENFRSTIVNIVNEYGFQALEIGDGEMAIAMLNSLVPDAILLDIRLPGISGLGILEMIKHMPHLRHIPVHMISAFDHQHNALRMGALGYLTKPVTVEKLHSALERITHLLSHSLRRILLIEDNLEQSKAITELISDNDIEVISVNNGKDAVNRVKQEIFDCIILDLKLPDVSGFEILELLNSLEISIPPTIIYTGKDLSEEEEKHLRKYSESIVIKGARSPERLLDEVNLFLHRVESLLPKEKREILSQIRSDDTSFAGKTLLIVDDDIRNIFALTSALEEKGFKIVVARDGLEALNVIEENSSIDLVLMDIMMPRMNGFEAMIEIRKNKNNLIKNLPIIALTAKAMKDDHEKAMSAGASDYLPKPVNLDNLTTVLKVWLTPKGFF